MLSNEAITLISLTKILDTW